MKNKSKKIIKISLAILLVVLIQAVGVTYAKYWTSETGKGGAEVAKWAFKMDKDGKEVKTINLADSIDDDTLVDGKIAPGTSGEFAIKVDGTGSEVGIDYQINFCNEQNKPSNISYNFNGTTYASLSEIVIQGTIPYYAENKTREHLISWQWDYETGSTDSQIATNDQLDMQAAEAITGYTFDIVATGTQKI